MSLSKDFAKGYTLTAFLAFPSNEDDFDDFLKKASLSFQNFNFHNGTGFFFNQTNTTKILEVTINDEELDNSLKEFKSLVSHYNKIFNQKSYLISVNKIYKI
jgi:hypothetical protein